MPPRGRRGGGYLGGIPSNSTMSTANAVRDFFKTTSHPAPGASVVGGGYLDEGTSFSYIAFGHRLSLAWDLSYDRKGHTRIGAFLGNFRALGGGAQAKKAKFDKVYGELTKARDEGTLDPQTYAERIMYEAMSYYGYLQRIAMIDKEEYYEEVYKFADANGIDFEFEGLSRGR